MQQTKKAIQDENEALKREIEQYKQALNKSRSEAEMLARDSKILNESIANVRLAASEHERGAKAAKKEAAEYKQEVDSLKDTKSVLDKLMSMLTRPQNDYQEVVDELRGELQHARNHADALEQELRSVQFDIQQNRFLDGKVQAYESILKAGNAARPAEWVG